MAILVIDDDVELCELLRKVFARESLTARFIHDGMGGLNEALREPPELIVLDVMLPRLDGFEVLRRLRRESQTPVLMLTARGEELDRIVGLEIGADDYLSKPFHPRELVARIRAILRRSAPPKPDPAAVLEANGVRLDPGERSVTRDGEPVELTTTELDLLAALLESAGRVLSRDALLERLDGRAANPFDRSVDVHVSHLRKKLGGDRPLIKTVRGVGYQFVRSAAERE
ncbi:MAG: response regulator [Acidobacteria bacterium]|nr:response regulator [Acidobacteriota bacterium]